MKKITNLRGDPIPQFILPWFLVVKTKKNNTGKFFPIRAIRLIVVSAINRKNVKFAWG